MVGDIEYDTVKAVAEELVLRTKEYKDVCEEYKYPENSDSETVFWVALLRIMFTYSLAKERCLENVAK